MNFSWKLGQNWIFFCKSWSHPSLPSLCITNRGPSTPFPPWNFKISSYHQILMKFYETSLFEGWQKMKIKFDNFSIRVPCSSPTEILISWFIIWFCFNLLYNIFIWGYSYLTCRPLTPMKAWRVTNLVFGLKSCVIFWNL